MTEIDCDPEVEFCDSEIPLNDIDQEYDPEGLKWMGWTGMFQIIIPAAIAGELIEQHMIANDIAPFEYLANASRYTGRMITKMRAKMTASASKTPVVRQDDDDEEETWSEAYESWWKENDFPMLADAW